MALADDLADDVRAVISESWNAREGQEVPSSETVALAGGAVELDATFLYADLAHSSRMSKELDRRIAAKILKSFLGTTARLVRSGRGEIVSFDGDRILGVFTGKSKNTAAAKCALQINYTVRKIIKPEFESEYAAVRNACFSIGHGVGIDSGKVLAVRAGARGDNDLIWIGRAPNLAAKLSDFRKSPYHTYITGTVYRHLHDSLKHGGPEGKSIWEPQTWTFLGDKIELHRSSSLRKP